MMSKFSILGMVAGFIFAVVSFVQYYILYRDIDRIISYPLIGLLVIVVSYLYNEIVKLNNTLNGVEEYLVEKK